jgi:TRAP-type C4-dicarboxylate transport system permease small subunit
MASPLAITEVVVDAVDADEFSPREDRIEWAFRWITQIIVVLLMAIIGAEVIVRSVFSSSLQVTNELGGFALVALTFLSMSTCQVNHAYHRVHFLDARLSARGRAALRLLFDALSLLVTLVLVWQFARFEIISFKSGDVTSSNLMTPFWIPRAVMVIGVAGLAVTLARTIRADLRRFRATASGRVKGVA